MNDRPIGMLLGPEILGSAKAVHAKEIAKEMLMGDFKRGGKVKKTGIYKLHKGEHVMTAKQSKSHPCLDC